MRNLTFYGFLLILTLIISVGKILILTISSVAQKKNATCQLSPSQNQGDHGFAKGLKLRGPKVLFPK